MKSTEKECIIPNRVPFTISFTKYLSTYMLDNAAKVSFKKKSKTDKNCFSYVCIRVT